MSGVVLRLMALGALTAQAGLAGAQAAPSWQRSVAPDGSFSAETRCTTAEVDGAGLLPAQIVPGVALAPAQRVACLKDGMMFVAGVVDQSFDALVAEVAADKTTEGTQKLTSTDGRRTFLNRQVEGQQVAQTGFIELSPTKLILILSGVQKGTALSVAEQQAIGDRFAASIRVGGARK